MTQKMEFKNGDIYINDVLAWRNPDRSGILRGVSAHHIDNELWVNNQLVYVHPVETHPGHSDPDKQSPQPGRSDADSMRRFRVPIDVATSLLLLFILGLISWAVR